MCLHLYFSGFCLSNSCDAAILVLYDFFFSYVSCSGDGQQSANRIHSVCVCLFPFSFSFPFEMIDIFVCNELMSECVCYAPVCVHVNIWAWSREFKIANLCETVRSYSFNHLAFICFNESSLANEFRSWAYCAYQKRLRLWMYRHSLVVCALHTCMCVVYCKR